MNPGSRTQKAQGRRRVVKSQRREARGEKLDASRTLPRLIPAVAMLVWIGLIAPVAGAATIQGIVFDPSGSAVAAAHVSLLAPSALLVERQTDSEGKYSFEGLRAGTYTVVAESPGLSTSSPDVKIQAGETRAVDLHLQLSAVEEQVVVSASLDGALAPEVGSSITILTSSQIQDLGAQSVLDSLRQVPGVAVNQTGRRGGATGVFIRGGNSNYNLVLLDGIEVNQFGGEFDFAPITVDGVDRIEVTRGPESALYGSNAVSGVVNVVSQRGEGPPHFSALAEGGSFGTWRASTGGSGLTRGVGWAYDLARLDSGGMVRNDSYRDQSAFFSLGFSRSPRRQLNLHLYGDANDAGAPGPFGSDPDHLYDAPIFPGGPTNREVGEQSRDKQNIFSYEGTYSEQFSARFKQVVTGYVARNRYYFISPFGDSFSNNLRGVLNTRSELSISNRDFLVAGFEYNREQIKNTYIASSGVPFLLPRRSLAYFAENRWSPSRRLFVNTGVRADYLGTRELPPDSSVNRPALPASSVVQVSPRMSAAYIAREGVGQNRFGATRLHGSFGTGIRAPNGFELAFNNNNPNLKPERSVSFDVGVEQRLLSDRAVFDATYFYNRFRDQIVVLGGSLTNLSSFTSANLGNSRAQGMEISARLRPARAIRVEGGYTLLATSILAVGNAGVALSPFQVGQPLIRRPRNSGYVNVSWRHNCFTLNGNGYFRGRVLDLEPNDGTFACALGLPCLFTNKGYTVANAGLSYRLPRGVEVYGRINNLLNQRYEESFGYPALRLNFLAGIRFNFFAE